MKRISWISFLYMLVAICAAPVVSACYGHAGVDLAIKLVFFSAPCFALTTITSCALGAWQAASHGEGHAFYVAMIFAIVVIWSLTLALGWLLFNFPLLPASY